MILNCEKNIVETGDFLCGAFSHGKLKAFVSVIKKLQGADLIICILFFAALIIKTWICGIVIFTVKSVSNYSKTFTSSPIL